MNLGLKGRRALVTAASQGLGFACAEALASEGARVAICSRDLQRASAAARTLGERTGATVHGFRCDLRVESDRNQLLNDVRQTGEQLDILVFNHGNPPTGNFESVGSAEWEEGVSLVLRSAIHLCRGLVPDMMENGWGRIVFLNSVFAREPDPAFVISATLRAGLLALAKCLSREFGPHGVTVNSVLPGYFETPLLRTLAEQEAAKEDRPVETILADWARQMPSGFLGQGPMLGQLVAWLCSSGAQNVIGAVIPCDGGLLRTSA